MIENSNKRVEYDFVARDNKHNIICVSGRNDSFIAIWSNGIWKTGYPNFDDLMDNFSEEKDLSEIQKLSTEARNSIKRHLTRITRKSQIAK
jgi:hypothetical protein